MNPKKEKAYVEELLTRFPVIYKWVMQVPKINKAVSEHKGEMLRMFAGVLGPPEWIQPVLSDDVTRHVVQTTQEIHNGVRVVDEEVIQPIVKEVSRIWKKIT